MLQDNEIRIFGWGRWGDTIAQSLMEYTLPPPQTLKIHSFTEDNAGLTQICPSPQAAELFFLSWFFHSDVPPPWNAPVRLHILHAGEHYGTGAATAFLRKASLQQECMDIGVVLLPPSGSNQATVGRFCANLYGAPTLLFDACILLDAGSALLLHCDDALIEKMTRDIIKLILCLDRSGCMLPLLRRMRARSLSLFMMEMDLKEPLSEQNFPETFVARNTIHCSTDIFSKVADFLSFSVLDNAYASRLEQNLQQLHKRYIGRDKILHIPFARRHEWKDLSLPAGFQPRTEKSNSLKGIFSKKKSNFTAIFSADVLPERMAYFLKAYYQKYWHVAETTCQTEYLDEDTQCWLKINIPKFSFWLKNGIAVNFQPIEYVRAAKAFIAERREKI